MNLSLGPLERCCLLIPLGNKGFNGLYQHRYTDEACPLQGTTAQDAKPTFNLIEPAALGGSEMKMNGRMGFKPAVISGLVGVKIIEYHMELLRRIFSDKLVHEIQKFASASAPIMTRMDQAGGHFQRRKKRGRAVAFVFVTKACQGPAIGQAYPALGPFQGLDVGFFIDTDYDRVCLRWI